MRDFLEVHFFTFVQARLRLIWVAILHRSWLPLRLWDPRGLSLKLRDWLHADGMRLDDVFWLAANNSSTLFP